MTRSNTVVVPLLMQPRAWLIRFICVAPLFFLPSRLSAVPAVQEPSQPLVWWVQDVLSQGLSQATLRSLTQELSMETGRQVSTIGSQDFTKLLDRCHDEDAPDLILGTGYILAALVRICPYRVFAVTHHSMAFWVLSSSEAHALEDIRTAATNQTAVSVVQAELTSIAPSVRLIPFNNYREAVVALLSRKTDALLAFPGVVHVLSPAVRQQLRLVHRLQSKPQILLVVKRNLASQLQPALTRWLTTSDSATYQITTKTLEFAPWRINCNDTRRTLKD